MQSLSNRASLHIVGGTISISLYNQKVTQPILRQGTQRQPSLTPPQPGFICRWIAKIFGQSRSAYF